MEGGMTGGMRRNTHACTPQEAACKIGCALSLLLDNDLVRALPVPSSTVHTSPASHSTVSHSGAGAAMARGGMGGTGGAALAENGSLRWCLVGTQLGAGVFTSNMDPGDAIFIFHELDRARREGIVTGNPLHVLYLVAPVPHPVSPNYLLLPNYASLRTSPRNTYIIFSVWREICTLRNEKVTPR